MAKITLSVIKADVGGFVGHSSVHQKLKDRAKEYLDDKKDILTDYNVLSVGDDIELIMTHRKGVNNSEIHQLAWDTFKSCTEVAKELKLYGAGQDLLEDAFSGNIRGLGPGVAEMEFEERKSEPVIIYMADKTEPGAWNFPLYKVFADPFNTIGLVLDPKMHDGFKFEILDLREHKTIHLSSPEDIYDILLLIGSPGRYCVKSVSSKKGELVSVSSTQTMNYIAGRYIGKDDPVMMIRTQNGFPAVGEALEPFANPHIVAGWMRGCHNAPLIPVAIDQARPTRFDGPPRVVAAGYQICDGKLEGPQDMFADMAFDNARKKGLDIADTLRQLGPFEPHRLPLEDLEYTTLPLVLKKLENKFISE
jgi:fructose 1,6-bisphosphate aldolase/phosphatase